MDARVNRPENSDFEADGGFVRVQGAREHNLRNLDVEIPRDALRLRQTGLEAIGRADADVERHARARRVLERKP